MNKKDFYKIIAEDTGLTQKNVQIVFESIFNNISEISKTDNEYIRISGIGKFKVKNMNGGQITTRNGKIIKYGKYKKISFKFSKKIKDKINNRIK